MKCKHSHCTNKPGWRYRKSGYCGKHQNLKPSKLDKKREKDKQQDMKETFRVEGLVRNHGSLDAFLESDATKDKHLYALAVSRVGYAPSKPEQWELLERLVSHPDAGNDVQTFGHMISTDVMDGMIKTREGKLVCHAICRNPSTDRKMMIRVRDKLLESADRGF